MNSKPQARLSERWMKRNVTELERQVEQEKEDEEGGGKILVF